MTPAMMCMSTGSRLTGCKRGQGGRGNGTHGTNETNGTGAAVRETRGLGSRDEGELHDIICAYCDYLSKLGLVGF